MMWEPSGIGMHEGVSELTAVGRPLVCGKAVEYPSGYVSKVASIPGKAGWDQLRVGAGPPSRGQRFPWVQSNAAQAIAAATAARAKSCLRSRPSSKPRRFPAERRGRTVWPRRPHSLGAAAVAETHWVPAASALLQPHCVAHLAALQLVGCMSVPR
jgi:hypothetical protein